MRWTNIENLKKMVRKKYHKDDIYKNLMGYMNFLNTFIAKTL